MPTLSCTPPERARKTLQRVFQHLQEPGTGVSLATSMGVSEATISRIKNERMEEVLLLLAHLGFKVVRSEMMCVDPASYAFLRQTHERVMRKAPDLIWEADEE